MVQRTGASRFAQRQIERHRRLAPVAYLCVRRQPRAMTTRKKALLAIATVLWVPIVAFLSYGYIYQPLKYRYLISRVESARTASEEHAAFRIAADWGRVWEVDRLRPEDAAID